VKTLGEVCDQITDGTHQTPTYFEDGYIFLSSKSVTSGIIDWGKSRFIDENQHKAMQKRVSPKRDDILLAKNGTTGVAALVDRDIDFDIYVSLALLRPKKIITPRLLLYFINSPMAKDQFNKRIKGVGVPNLHLQEIREVRLTFPVSIPEQRRIVSILDEAFAGLDVMRANAEKNLQNARDLFDSYLNAVFSEKGEGWVETTLGEIADFKNGLNFTQSSKGEIIRIVGVKDFKNFFWIPDDGLDSVQIDGTLGPAYELRENDILTVRSNGNKQLIGRCILAGPVSEKTSHSGFTIRMRIKSTEIEPRFLVRYLKSAAIHNSLIESGDGANISSLNQKALTALPIMFPSRDSQQSIITRFDELEVDSDRLQSLYRQKLAAISELKQSILQKAFTGELTTSESIAA
jgi:type I restriction enzyme, S subunit